MHCLAPGYFFLSRSLLWFNIECVLAVRSAKFVASKHWIVTGADDKFIRVFDYDTTEKITEFEAHTDFIRSVAVHPTLPYLLSASDDMVNYKALGLGEGLGVYSNVQGTCPLCHASGL